MMPRIVSCKVLRGSPGALIADQLIKCLEIRHQGILPSRILLHLTPLLSILKRSLDSITFRTIYEWMSDTSP